MAQSRPELDRSALAALLLQRGVTKGPDVGTAGPPALWEKALLDWSRATLGVPPEYRLVNFDPTLSPPVFPVRLEIAGCPAGLGSATDFNAARAAASIRAAGWLTHFCALLLAHRLERGVPNEQAAGYKIDVCVYEHLLREEAARAAASTLAESIDHMTIAGVEAHSRTPQPYEPTPATPFHGIRVESEDHAAPDATGHEAERSAAQTGRPTSAFSTISRKDTARAAAAESSTNTSPPSPTGSLTHHDVAFYAANVQHQQRQRETSAMPQQTPPNVFSPPVPHHATPMQPGMQHTPHHVELPLLAGSESPALARTPHGHASPVAVVAGGASVSGGGVVTNLYDLKGPRAVPGTPAAAAAGAVEPPTSRAGSQAYAQAPPHSPAREQRDDAAAKARRWLLQFLKEQTRPLPPSEGTINPKADLANWCGQVGLVPPVYDSSKEGPDHYPTFVVGATLRGVQIGIGRGTRKTQAEVEAASVALRQLSVWTRCLQFEGDKYFRLGSVLPLSLDRERLYALAATPSVFRGPELLQTVLRYCNAFMNSDGGVVLVGADPASLVFTGLPVSREEMDDFLQRLQEALAQWQPAASPTLLRLRVWPLFSEEQIYDGRMFELLEEMVARRDARGILWRPGHLVTLSITVFKGEDVHTMPLAQLSESDREGLQADSVSFFYTRNGPRLVPT